MTKQPDDLTAEEKLARKSQYGRAWRAANREKMRGYWRAAYFKRRGQPAEDPEKDKARKILQNHVYVGNVSRSNCETCGAEEAHGHHYDHTRPLDVVWLCQRCHNIYHDVERRVAELRAKAVTEDLY